MYLFLILLEIGDWKKCRFCRVNAGFEEFMQAVHKRCLLILLLRC